MINKQSASKHPILTAAEQFLAARRRYVLAVIVTVSVILRIVYFVQLNSGPCIWQHRWDQSDMNFFDSWARQIASGDYLSERVVPPLHIWHIGLAQQYYRLHPGQLELAKNSGVDPVQAIWDRWWGGKRFYQGPLYPYLVALTYRVSGQDVRWVFAWQMLIGVMGNVLIYLIARKYFGELVAVVAAALALSCSPILYYELILLRATLISFAGLVLVYLTTLAMERRKWQWWLVVGMILGLSMMLKAMFALFLLGAALALVVHHGRHLQKLAISGGAFAAGFLIAMSPLMVRNVRLGVQPFTVACAGGVIFISSNTVDYAGTSVYVSPTYAAPIMD